MHNGFKWEQVRDSKDVETNSLLLMGKKQFIIQVMGQQYLLPLVKKNYIFLCIYLFIQQILVNYVKEGD